jgi:inhibitor of Bruton tyrosine kinase
MTDSSRLTFFTDFIQTVDEFLELMFDVMAAAVSHLVHSGHASLITFQQNELLLDRLVLLCSAVILRYCTLYNVCYLLTEASHFHSVQLVERIQKYISVNLETLLESRMLDELTSDLVNELGVYIRKQQALKSPISRTNRLVDKAMERNADWLAIQDIPQPLVRTNRLATNIPPPNLPISSPARISRNLSASSIPPKSPSNAVKIDQSSTIAGDVFSMDDTAHSVSEDASIAPSTSAWKGVSFIPR